MGASVTDAMARQAPDGLLGIHMNLLVTTLGGAMLPTEPEQERAAADAPLVVTNDTGQRLYETQVGQRYGRGKSAPTRPTPTLPARPAQRR